MANENPHTAMTGTLEPPPHVRVSMGAFGVVGVIVSIITFLLDIESDAMLAYLLWCQAEDTHGTPTGEEAYGWFIITVIIITLPMVILNIFSLLWYWQNRQCLGDYCILHKMTMKQKSFRVVMHILLLGPLIRYVDTLFYGLRAKRATRHVTISGQPVIRRTPMGEVYAVLQMIPQTDDSSQSQWVYYREDEGYVITYPVITAIVLSAHWMSMTVWIHAQKTNFCSAEDESRQPVLEMLYNVVMGWVHCFCYINLKDGPTRLRMTFFYVIIGIQNTVFISVWYVEVFDDYEALWFKVTIVAVVEVLFLLGLCALIGYYAFLHPESWHQGMQQQHQHQPDYSFSTTNLQPSCHQF